MCSQNKILLATVQRVAARRKTPNIQRERVLSFTFPLHLASRLSSDQPGITLVALKFRVSYSSIRPPVYEDVVNYALPLSELSEFRLALSHAHLTAHGRRRFIMRSPCPARPTVRPSDRPSTAVGDMHYPPRALCLNNLSDAPLQVSLGSFPSGASLICEHREDM